MSIRSGIRSGIRQPIRTGIGAIAGGGGTPLLLDTYPNAAFAFSLKKLRTAYTGKAIRVRRSSDSTELDIGFVSGELDVSALLGFVGVGNGFVAKWYDQSGNGIDLVQTTASTQPKIVTSGAIESDAGYYAVTFDGTDDSIVYSGNLSALGSVNTFFTVLKNNIAIQNVYIFGTNNLSSPEIFNNNGRIRMDNGSSFFTDDIPVGTSKELWSLLFNTAGSKIYRNGTLKKTGDSGSNTFASLSIRVGARGNSTLFFNGKLFQMICFNGNKDANIPGINTMLNANYSIY